jgi:hypothetical protein
VTLRPLSLATTQMLVKRILMKTVNWRLLSLDVLERVISSIGGARLIVPTFLSGRGTLLEQIVTPSSRIRMPAFYGIPDTKVQISGTAFTKQWKL